VSRQPLRLVVLEAERILTDAGVASPRVDAELLAAHVVGVPRGRLPMVPLVDPSVAEALRTLVFRRAERVPLQHLTGTAVMGAIDVAVGPGVFVPRPETEMLLAWGLAAAGERLGVRIFERTPATALDSDADGVTVRTPDGVLRAGQVALATSAFPALVRRLRPYVVPVYDYVLMTEPLSAAQRAGIGWRHRQGIGDSGNQFHYYRLTADDRILWGGYDAIYHFGRGIRAAYDQRPATFATLAAHFFATFPQLEGIGFSHRWGGVIDTCSRFCAFFGTARHGRAYRGSRRCRRPALCRPRQSPSAARRRSRRSAYGG